MQVTAQTTRIVVDGPALTRAVYPVTVDPEIGTNDFRISDAGGTGTATAAAFRPAVAFNATANEYLMVWYADDTDAGLVDGEREIFGQRLAFRGDDFAARIPLVGTDVTTTGSTVGFSRETGEPGDLVVPDPGSPTAWWSWTAPCSGSATQPTSFIDTNGSNFDTVLAVFTGTSLGGLTRLDSDDNSGMGNQSRVPSSEFPPTTLNIVAGTEYQVRVRGFAVGDVGDITLNIHSPCAVPLTVSAVTPRTGPTTGFTNVTITGTGFTTGASVSIGGGAPTSVVVVSATTITANTGAHAAGLVDVVVTNPDMQTGTRVSGFQFVTPFEPVVAGTTPIQAVHFTGLLGRINIQLGRFGRPAHAFTNPIAPGAIVQARDLTELYAAVNDALDAAGEPTLAVPTVTAGVTIPVTSHLTNVRAKVLVLEALEVP